MIRKNRIFSKKRKNLLEVSIITDLHVVYAANGDENYPPIGNRLLYTPINKMSQWVDDINLKKPALAVCLGDVINGDGDTQFDESFDLFMSEWNRIDAGISKSISAGNHDYSSTIPSTVNGVPKHQYISNKFGYTGAGVDGCIMQEAFYVEKSGLRLKLINFDTNRLENGDYSTNGGFLSQITIDWIRGEMENASCRNILLTTHRFRPLMLESECLKLEQAVAEAKLVNPNINVYLVFGHRHPSVVLETESLYGNFKQLNIPALVDNLTSYAVSIQFDHNGMVSYKTEPYTYL